MNDFAATCKIQTKTFTRGFLMKKIKKNINPFKLYKR